MTTPKRTDPLNGYEIEEAAELFFELFNIILAKAPEGTTIEDGIKLAETIFAYAHTRRATALEEDSIGPFGFNKKEDV
jgi:hypothetical protein